MWCCSTYGRRTSFPKNKRGNDNLEQQAQALFDHYFDSGSIYLEDSIMGCLTDIAVYLNGLAMQKFPATDIERSLPVLKIKELGQRKCDDCSDRCSDSIDADYIIDNEDIIFSWSGTLMVDVWCGGKCGLNQHLFKVTPLKNYPRWFVYYWTNRHLKKFKLIAKDKAVTMGHIRRGDLENAEVAIPTNLNMLEINARINPLFQSIIDRRLEITKLENIRDALLPKLMSGELTKVCSSRDPHNPHYIKELKPEEYEVKMGDKAGDGTQLRPFIVWFGEAVPEIETAIQYVEKADIFVIIGTSLNVYPAAGLLHYVPRGAEVYLIDPKPVDTHTSRPIHVIQKGASEGVAELKQLLGV